MVALQVAHLDRLDPRLDAAVAHARGGRACSGRACGRAARASSISAKVESPAMLKLRDVVHLDRDVERHGSLGLLRHAR